MFKLQILQRLCYNYMVNAKNTVQKSCKTEFSSSTLCTRLLQRFHPIDVKGKQMKLLEQCNNNNNKQIIRYKSSDVITKECEVGGGASLPCHIRDQPPAPCAPTPPIKYAKCKRVCLRCCKPAQPDDACLYTIRRLNNCKPIKYKYPPFSRTATHIPLKATTVPDCCYFEECCRRYNIGQVQTQMSITERQRSLLGFKEKGECPLLNVAKRREKCKREFSTFTSFWQKVGDGCDKQGGLSCLKIDTMALKKIPKSRKTCDKLCMPCCKPCREPPYCSFVYVKPPCKKLKPSRPSFSECQDILQDPDKCECVAPPIEPCKWGKKQDENIGCSK